MLDLLALCMSGSALLLGASALVAVNRLRPVTGRLAAGLGGIVLTAYGVVAAGDVAAPLLAGDPPPASMIMVSPGLPPTPPLCV